MKLVGKETDMRNGPLTGKIIAFALPLAFTSMLQQLFNAADTLVVGRLCGANALAAVGTNTEIVALLVSVSMGLASGVNVLLAHLIGKNTRSEIREGMHTGLCLSVLTGLFLALAGQMFSRPLLALINTPAAVFDDAVLYLKIYCLGLPFLLLYDFGAAILRSKGDSMRPFAALTVSGIVNVLLNLFFVIGPKLGVAGVALASDISTAFCAAAAVFWLSKEPGEFHFSFRYLCLCRKYLMQILKTGIPTALQGAVFCFANIFVQSAVNSFGETAAAGSAIAMNTEYFAYYMITAFGQAASTFTAQNYAASRMDRCRKILKISLLFGFLFASCITFPITAFRVGFAGLFSTDSGVIAAAAERISIILAYTSFCAFYEVPAGVLRGCGHPNVPAVLTVTGTCCLRILWIFTVFRMNPAPKTLFIIFPITWIVTIMLFIGSFAVLKPISDGK